MATPTWAKVQFGEVVGFVHAGYLGQDGGMTTTSGAQLGIECIGTEPFWHMTFDTDNMVRMTMTGGTAAPVPVGPKGFSPTATGYPYAFNAAPYSGEVTFEICSDDMSDTIYPMSIHLTAPGDQGTPIRAYGCCSLH